MRQNRAASAPFFYCVSYEILRETRIKPSFFGNCLIFPSSALGASAWAVSSRRGVLVPSGDRPGPTEPAGETLAAARAHREDSARARRRRVGPLSRLAATAPPKGEPSLASPFGGGALQRRAERARRYRPGKALRCFPSFFSGCRPLRSRPWDAVPSRLPPRSSAERCPPGTSAPASFLKKA